MARKIVGLKTDADQLGGTNVTLTSPADNEVLAYDTSSGELINQTPAEAGLIPDSEKGAASGVAELDANSVLTSAQRPQGGFYLDGTSGNYASTPDSAALSVTGDIDIRAHVNRDDWDAVSIPMTLVGKYTTSGNQRAYRFYIASGGMLTLAWSSNGTVFLDEVATVALSGLTDDEATWVRATLDVDNGASGYDVKFYTSSDGSSWTQLGATVTGGATTSIFDSTASLRVGDIGAGAGFEFTGTVYQAQVYDGIDGTLVANPVFQHPPTAWTMAGTTSIDSEGNVWTLNGSAWEWRE